MQTGICKCILGNDPSYDSAIITYNHERRLGAEFGGTAKKFCRPNFREWPFLGENFHF